MKLRWIDSKSNRVQEVYVDLQAILNQPTLEMERPELCDQKIVHMHENSVGCRGRWPSRQPLD
jgi:hypothetical protein